MTFAYKPCIPGPRRPSEGRLYAGMCVSPIPSYLATATIEYRNTKSSIPAQDPPAPKALNSFLCVRVPNAPIYHVKAQPWIATDFYLMSACFFLGGGRDRPKFPWHCSVKLCRGKAPAPARL